MRLATFPVLIASFVCLSQPEVAVAGPPRAIEFQWRGQRIRGLPLMDFPQRMLVLAPDGQIHSLTGDAKAGARPSASPYQPATAMEMRSQLQSEYGRDFVVRSTNHFLVVQPRGRGDRWPDLFERCHRSFVHFMSLRGVHIRRGRFPMVAVVMPDEAAMYRELGRLGIRATGVSGIYEQDSNRVITHDGGHLRYIASTVRHEAAHQSAFNYNVHSRVVITPRWVTEGIGQMFEPESMVNGQSGLSSRDRVNAISLRGLKKTYDLRSTSDFADAVREIVGSDSRFGSSSTSGDAYNVAWGMMFYLAEREPKRFAAVLTGTAGRGTYAPYDRFARLNDFERWTGQTIDEFARRAAWFLHSL